MVVIASEIEPLSGKADEVARELQRLGFKIWRIGLTVSVDAPRELWEDVFKVRFEEVRKIGVREDDYSESYLKAKEGSLVIPASLALSVGAVHFVEPPELHD